jgi:hypothetical protein
MMNTAATSVTAVFIGSQRRKEAAPAMLDEVLDFVRFLKSGRFAPSPARSYPARSEEVETVCDRPRTLSDLADEQRAFLASLSRPLVDIDLPEE